MTSNGRRIAFLIGISIAFMLPKKVPCGYPGATECSELVREFHCKTYEVEPLGFYLLEHLWGGNVGFAYSRGTDC